MYNGIGLTTARGSGTNGYIQTNKFFVKPKLGKVASDAGKGFDAGQGTAGISRAPNRDILDHDRKRQIELKLVVLEDNLVDQGYTDAEIALRLADARSSLEALSAADPLSASDKKVSDTQTHQIAARKEKQMENLRAALGIRAAEPEEENADANDDDPINSQKNNVNDGRNTKREHAFLDRGYERKRHVEENQKSEKEDKLKNTKESKRKEESRRRRRHGHDSSDSDESAGKSRALKKKHRKSSRRSSDAEDDDSDSDIGRKGKISKKHKRSKSARDDSESDSDSSSSSSDYSDSASSYDSSDTDGSATNLKAVEKKHQRTHKGSDEEKDNKHKPAQRRKISKQSVGADTDSDSSEDDSRKKSSRKQVETSKRSHRRHDADDDSGSDGVLKAKKPSRSGRRHDSEDDSSSDSGMKKKNNRDVEEKKQNYKKSDQRHNDFDDDSESDKGPLKGKQHARTGRRLDLEDDSSSDSEIKAKNNRIEDERKQVFKKSDGMGDRKDDSSSEEGLWKSETTKEKQFVRTSRRHDSEDESDPDSGMRRRTSRDEEERKRPDSHRTRDEGFNNEDRKSRFVGEERSKRKPDLYTKPDDEKFRKPESKTIERSRRSGREDRGFDKSGGSSDDEKTEKLRGRRHDSSDEEPDSIYARNVSAQKPAEKRSDYGEKDLRTSTRDFEYKKNEQSKTVGESKSGDRDYTNRQARQRSPEDDFRSRRAAVDEERRKERSGDQYPNKDVKKDSGSIRSGGCDDVAGGRRDRSYRTDDEPPHSGGRRADRDYDQREGDRWRMGSEDEDHRGRKHGREEEDDNDGNKYRGCRKRDEERDGSERDRQRDYSKRARYDDYSRSGERRRQDNERGDDRARRRD